MQKDSPGLVRRVGAPAGTKEPAPRSFPVPIPPRDPEPVHLADLVAASNSVAATGSRRDKTARLAGLLRTAGPEEAPIAIGFLAGAPRQGRLNVGWAAARDATAEPAASEPSLTVADVDRAFDQIRAAAGKGSAGRRTEILRALFRRALPGEQAFLAALVTGEVRQGALDAVLADAVAAAASLSPALVRRAAMIAGDLGPVARAALGEGEAGLARFRLELFRPVQPMLADSAPDLGAALGRLGQAAIEWKLDGARVQVHKAGEEVRVYTRNLNDVTGAVPEVVDLVRRLPRRELILDGEVIALDSGGRPHPFQVTMRRFGRRTEVGALRDELPLSPVFFDLLRIDGEDLLDRPFSERAARLATALPAELVVPRIVTDQMVAAAGFEADARARGHEGVMVKDERAPYAAGRRGSAWLKVKVARTLDLVVLAAEWGSGRRKGWLSNLHLGARGPGGFVMLGKTFKGLTDEVLAWQTAELLARETGREGHIVYVRPELVVEVAFNEIQTSSRYTGGVTLRFARVKGYRPDKVADEADTIATVRALQGG